MAKQVHVMVTAGVVAQPGDAILISFPSMELDNEDAAVMQAALQQRFPLNPVTLLAAHVTVVPKEAS